VIQTQTLDSLLGNSEEQQADIIKLDIQGAELEALQGLGQKRLNDLLAVELEIGLSNIYKDAADFSGIQKFMNDEQFELFDVRVARSHLPAEGSDQYYQTRIFSVYPNSPTVSARICEFDAVYFRKRSKILETRDPEKIRRMLVCYLAYNFFAEAYSLVEESERREIFAPELSARLKGLIVTIHREREFQPWLANTKMWNAIRRLGMRVAPRSAPRWCQYMYQNYPSG
jgi:Methyltransferase FkbM domain